MTSFLSLRNAVVEYVHDGAPIAMEGVTHLIPFAAGDEIIRQQQRNLHVRTERARTGKANPHAGAN
jgi:glutaconate CoA-transferase, subunit A